MNSYKVETKARSTAMACGGPESASKRATELETEIKTAQSSQVPNTSAQEHLPRAHSAEIKLQIGYVFPAQNLGVFLKYRFIFQVSIFKKQKYFFPHPKEKTHIKRWDLYVTR